MNGRRVVEKEVTLRVAFALKKLIDAAPNLQAHMTRTTDRYLSLDDRLRYVTSLKRRTGHDGDLFISLHCNASAGRVGACGLELFYLDPLRADDAVRSIARLQGVSLRSSRLVSAREKTIRTNNIVHSRNLCDTLRTSFYQIPHYRRNTDRERPIQGRYLRVLLQGNMPAVLVEMGFLTNPDDTRALAGTAFQGQVAKALYNGIASYFGSQDKHFQSKLIALNTSGK